MKKRGRGPLGSFTPAEVGDRVDLTAPARLATRNFARAADAPAPDSASDAPAEPRLDTSGGMGVPTRRQLHRGLRREVPPEAQGRIDNFRPEQAPLNSEGKRNRNRLLPYHREAKGLGGAEAKIEHLKVLGSLWSVDTDVVLASDAGGDLPMMQGWGNPDTSVSVPQGSIAVYAGTRRIDARSPEDDTKTVRSLQRMFIIASKKCVVWDFDMISPLSDDDAEDDGETPEG